VRSIQYDLAFLSKFFLSKSLPKRRIIIPVGSTVKKYTSVITIGAIIEPSNIPNLNQSLFGSDNTLGATKASNKNTTDTIKAQARTPSELIKGYKLTIRNTIENTMPKDFDEDSSVGIWLVNSDIGILIVSIQSILSKINK
jgi:hypothetical protein